MIDWLTGNPAAVGWYVASTLDDVEMLRLWSGFGWSKPVPRWSDLQQFMDAAAGPFEEVEGLQHLPGRTVRSDLGAVLPPVASSVLARPGQCVETKRCVLAAPAILEAAAGHIRDRAAEYDKPDGERSMAQTVEAFNAVTGRRAAQTDKARSLLNGLIGGVKATGRAPEPAALLEALEGIRGLIEEGSPLRESEGWLFMELLKAVRDFTTAGGHPDSQEDRVAYAALGAEARRAGR